MCEKCNDSNKKMDAIDLELRQTINDACRKHAEAMDELLPQHQQNIQVSRQAIVATYSLAIALAEIQFIAKHFGIPMQSIDIAAQIYNGEIDVSSIINDKDALEKLVKEKLGANVDVQVMKLSDIEQAQTSKAEDAFDNIDLGDEELNKMLNAFGKNPIKA